MAGLGGQGWGMRDLFNEYIMGNRPQPVQQPVEMTPEEMALALAKYEEEMRLMQQMQAQQAMQARQMNGVQPPPQAFDHVKARQQALRRYAGYE